VRGQALESETQVDAPSIQHTIETWRPLDAGIESGVLLDITIMWGDQFQVPLDGVGQLTG
jgi:hypothetical protein